MSISTRMSILTGTSTGTYTQSNIRVAGEHGSMIQATGKALLTGIRERRRSLTEPPPEKPLKLVNLFVAAQSREGRTSPGAVEIEQVAVPGIEEALNGVDGIAPLEERIEVARPEERVIAEGIAERACPQQEEVEVVQDLEAVVAGAVVGR